jgi:hypothetical protein
MYLFITFFFLRNYLFITLITKEDRFLICLSLDRGDVPKQNLIQNKQLFNHGRLPKHSKIVSRYLLLGFQEW